MTPAYVLDWLERRMHNQIRWLRDGQQAFGPRHTWTHFEISGDYASIRVPVDVWNQVRPLIDVSLFDGGDRIYHVR